MTKGFEIFYHLIKENLKAKQDLLVAIVHFFLVDQDYKCIGLGSNFTDDDQNVNGSELLPSEWNKDNDGSFCIKYIQKKDAVTNKLVFRFDQINQSWFANFSLNSGHKTAEKEINVNSYITDEFKNLEKAFVHETSLENLLKLLKQEMDANLSTKPSLRVERTAAVATSAPPDFGPSSPPASSFTRPNRSPPDGAARVYPPVIGGNDVNPFGGVGGGMIFDPRDPSHFQYRGVSLDLGGSGRFGPPQLRGQGFGFVPPSARYDPFVPPGAEPDPRRPLRPRPHPGPGAPNPDHFSPPGFDDAFI